MTAAAAISAHEQHDDRHETLEVLGSAALVPVVVLGDATKAATLLGAFAAGGLRCAEITLRTATALDAIAAAADVPDVLVGAGTVLDARQARDAVSAGARFIVSPGLSLDVVAVGREAGVAVVPGVVTATEAMRALAAGLTTVKFFPAETSGGAPAVRALSAPFPTLRFMPTGGITATNAADYLDIPSVLAIGGSWVAPRALVDAGDFTAITELTRDAVALTRSLRGS